jgi:hypothetical protein
MRTWKAPDGCGVGKYYAFQNAHGVPCLVEADTRKEAKLECTRMWIDEVGRKLGKESIEYITLEIELLKLSNSLIKAQA